MVSGSACYSISNQSPSNARSYESLVAQRRIFTASESFSDRLNFREPPLPMKGGEEGSCQPPDGNCPLQPPDPYRGSAESKVSSSATAGLAEPAPHRGTHKHSAVLSPHDLPPGGP